MLDVSSSNTYYVTVTDGNYCTGVTSIAITINTPPTPSITGGPTLCVSGTIDAGSGYNSYVWGDNSTGETLDVSSSNTYYVTVTDGNYCTGTASQIVTIVSGVPTQPGSVTGNSMICQGTSNTYSISAVSGATSYTWTMPSGWTGTSSTNSITATAGSSSGTISVTANNICGSSVATTLDVTVSNGIPLQPGSISGSNPVCSGSVQTYSIAAVSGATSYTWTLPSGWTGTSTSTTINVTIGTAGGNIIVNGNNNCGSSPYRTLFVTVLALPPTPGPITGSTTICSGATQTYSITAVSGATSYLWSLPSGWTGSSTGTSINTTVGNTSGNVSVLAINNCGQSNTTRTLAVNVNVIPAQPGAITGNTSVCHGTTQVYSIASVAGATSYTWTLPSGWTGTSTTTSITTIAGTTGGTISVVAQNSCGSSSSQTISVTSNSILAQPGAITGNTTVCRGTAQTYSISPVSGADSYIWTLPSGWTGTSTSTSINCTIGVVGGNISVKATNGCGTSPVKVLAVTVNNYSAVTISSNPSNANFCSQVSPTSVILTATSGYSSYIWSPSGGNAQSDTVSSINTYLVTATTGAGCTTTASKAVTNNCALPTGLSTSNILGTSAKANWIQSQCRFSYTIQISVHGLNSWTQHTVLPSTFYSFTGLSLSTSYDWQIQTNCNTDGSINS